MLEPLLHVLHYALVVGGLAGLAVILMPHLSPRHPHRSSVGSRRAEHERRVEALRRSAAAGRLGSTQLLPHPILGDLDTGRPARPARPAWRTVAAASMLTAAVVHVETFAHHLTEGLAVASFFLVAALAQGLWVLRLRLSAPPALLLVGIAISLALIGLWLLSRTTGLGFGAVAEPEPVGAWDLTAVTAEALVVLACLSGLRKNPLTISDDPVTES